MSEQTGALAGAIAGRAAVDQALAALAVGPSERGVLRRLIAGQSAREIAAETRLCERHVSRLIGTMRQRAGAATTFQLGVYAGIAIADVTRAETDSS